MEGTPASASQLVRQSPHTVCGSEKRVSISELATIPQEGSEIRTVPAEKRCLKSNAD